MVEPTPLKNMRTSKWVKIFPILGVKNKKCEQNHPPTELFSQPQSRKYLSFLRPKIHTYTRNSFPSWDIQESWFPIGISCSRWTTKKQKKLTFHGKTWLFHRHPSKWLFIIIPTPTSLGRMSSPKKIPIPQTTRCIFLLLRCLFFAGSDS